MRPRPSWRPTVSTCVFFDALRPTPELSFAVKHYGTTAGLNITASHNPKEYNGYKVYWSDGAQLPPQHAAAIAKNMERLDIFNDIQRMDFDDAVRQGLVEFMGAETDEAFLANVLRQPIDPDVVRRVADRFKIVYTPFHGAGWHLVPEALHRLGMTQVIPVKEQMVLDGTFPTVESPNPENPEGFYLAIDLAKKVGSDLILGTDPDSDRVGVMVRGADGGVPHHHRQPDGRAAARLYHHGAHPQGNAAGKRGRTLDDRHVQDGAPDLRC